MFDTSVLVQALKSEFEGETADFERAKRDDSRALLRGTSEAWVASVTAFEMEFARGEPITFETIPFDGFAATTAAAMAREHIELACPKCWSPTAATSCPSCGSQGSRWKKMNDIYIAASAVAFAAQQNDQLVLYAYDNRFQRYLSRFASVEVKEPPESNPLLSTSARRKR